MKRKAFFVLVTLAWFCAGCRLQDKTWDLKALVPLAHADLSIKNLIKDSSIKQNADNTLSLVNQQTLKTLNISDLLKVPDTTFKKTVSLKQINLGTRILNKQITLGAVAQKAGFAGLAIVAANGHRVVVPALSSLSTGQTPINAQSFFTTATFIAGNLDFDIHNGFPIEITNMHFQLLNQGDTHPVIDDTIQVIFPGATHHKTYSLAGKTVSGSLIANILSMSSPGSMGDSVLVDTTNAISLTIKGYGMSVFSATAIFPAQNVVNDMLDINYNLQGPIFKSFIIKHGSIAFNTKSTIKDSLHLFYSIPGATKGGEPVSLSMVVPPASSGAQTLIDSFKLDGYSVDLTGQHHDTANTFYNILQVHLDSTGKLESLSLADSIYIFYGLLGVVPEYAKGYLGKKTYTIGPESADFDIFKDISVNKLTIPQLKVNLQITNGVGASAIGKISSLVAYNSKTKKSVRLQSPTYVNKPIVITSAKDNYPNGFTPSYVNIPLDNQNSNINKMLEILPDQFLYSMEFTIDPNGNNNNYGDFIYYESSISATLNVELPLTVGVEGLVLEDTLTPDFGTSFDASRIEDGTLHLMVTNDYPMEAKVQLYMLDPSGKITDSLIAQNTGNMILPGSGAAQNPVPGKSTINIGLSNYQWNQLVAKKRLILKAVLNTANKGVVTIYSNNHLKANLSGDFKYKNTLK